jgi:hypothetical protein
MGGQIVGHDGDHRLPSPVAGIQQATRRIRCGGF